MRKAAIYVEQNFWSKVIHLPSFKYFRKDLHKATVIIQFF